ncbi:MAG: ABC transporter substrate-binding protein [Coriobacteriales bacterium]|jgi:peptide/nickel transport system substrate-binding protein|nr:ABC transporter substrate-binding protein [Coriobacteriales bacterium]
MEENKSAVTFDRRQFVQLLGAATAGVAAFNLVGCTDTGTSGGGSKADTITYAQGADPRALDPAYFDDGESAKVSCNIYEGLYRYGDRDTTVHPALAAELPDITPDGLVYTIALREGVKFHDGTDFDAEAVKASVERQLEPNLDPDMPYATFVFGCEDDGYGVIKVDVVDPLTVQFTLRTPSASFLKNLAMALAAPIVSPAALEAQGGNISDNPCGTGPYKFVSWTKGAHVILEANADYWDKTRAAKTKNLIFQVIPENATRVTALLNGEVDIIDGVDVSMADQIRGGGYTLFAEDGMTINYMAFNTESGVCTDVAVRKAIAKAINVPEMVDVLYGEFATAAISVMPLWMAPFNKNNQPIGYHPEEAAKELDDLGITQLECITYSNPRPYNTKNGQVLAETIQGYLKAVGVEVNITPYDWTTYKSKVQTEAFDFCFYGWTGDNGDPDNFMNLLGDQNWSMNVARFNDDDYRALIKKGLETPEGPDRDAVYLACEQMVIDKQPWLPISHSKNLCGVNPAIHDFFYHPTGDVFMWEVTKDA